MPLLRMRCRTRCVTSARRSGATFSTTAGTASTIISQSGVPISHSHAAQTRVLTRSFVPVKASAAKTAIVAIQTSVVGIAPERAPWMESNMVRESARDAAALAGPRARPSGHYRSPTGRIVAESQRRPWQRTDRASGRCDAAVSRHGRAGRRCGSWRPLGQSEHAGNDIPAMNAALSAEDGGRVPAVRMDPAKSAGGRRSWRAWLPHLAFFLLTCAVFAPAVRIGFRLDDGLQVLSNAAVRDFDLGAIFGRGYWANVRQSGVSYDPGSDLYR